MATWKAQTGRISLFPVITSGTSVPSAIDLYKKVWGTDPDSFQKQASLGLPFAPSFAQGQRNGLAVICSVNPARIDFAVGPPITQDSQVNLVEDLETFFAALRCVVQSAHDFDPPTSRAGCYVQLAKPAANYQEANKAILSVLPTQFHVGLSDEQDFVFQINRPQREEGLQINYITKWSVDRVQILNVQFGVGQTQLVSEHVVSSITFDNNSHPVALLTKDQVVFVLNKTLQAASATASEINLKAQGEV
jgi:hypothetical protein